GYQYLAGRQLSAEPMKQFGVGYAAGAGSDLTAYLRSKGFADELINESGLTGFDEKRGVHDKFWNRVMFPIQDSNHRVIGFGGRVMGDAKPKYLNSPETMIFDKSRNLYGLNFARTSRKGNIILCEGYMDVIAMHQAGFTQAVASLGTAFTTGQASLLGRYTEDVLLAYDSDGAGVNAAMRAIGILKESGLRGKVIDMQPYKDPDEFVKNMGADAFQERIDQAQNSFFFELKILERDYNMEDPESKTAFHREIAKKLCGFEEEVERENYIESVAQKYNIGFDNLRKLVSGYAARTGLVQPVARPRSTVTKKNTPEENTKRSQRLLLTWITEEPEIYPKIKAYITAADFTQPLYRQVADRLFADLEQGSYNPAAIISTFEEEQEQRAVAELFNTRLEEITTDKEREKALHDILCAVKQNSFDYYSGRMGSDMDALNQVISGKKALEELRKTHISL
ncbi:MAG: toprim domain-containing protein, partial [Lachnospiraceae bacterium]|nr:toprim domain-containing protein [Lachnospiraceae bacterium]